MLAHQRYVRRANDGNEVVRGTMKSDEDGEVFAFGESEVCFASEVVLCTVKLPAAVALAGRAGSAQSAMKSDKVG